MGCLVANTIALHATLLPFLATIASRAFELLPRYAIRQLAQAVAVPDLQDGLMADIATEVFFRFGQRSVDQFNLLFSWRLFSGALHSCTGAQLSGLCGADRFGPGLWRKTAVVDAAGRWIDRGASVLHRDEHGGHRAEAI